MKTLRNERGQLTVDFIFAIVLILGFTAMLFMISFTLSVASVTQYITYAAARNYMLAHISIDLQTERGQAKYHDLVTQNRAFKPLFSNGWYKIDPEATITDHTTVIQGYQAATQGVNQFWGAGTHFAAPVLDFNIPFFGPTVTDDSGTGQSFITYIGSYLGREPTTTECLNFTKQRWTAIRNLAVSGGAPYSTGTSDTGYYTMADDGC